MKLMAKSGLLAAAGSAVLAVAPAWSEDPATAKASEVPEIVVTAQFRQQKLIDVPISITALNGADLQRLGILDLHQLSLHTPGFYVQDKADDYPGIVMRGVTLNSTNPTDEPRISIYQDGVSISQVPAASVALFDVERVEVVKGPQTTLYGRSALAGAVSIIDNKATEAGFDWSMHAEGGNDSYGLIEGMANAPLNAAFAVRGAFFIERRDGYVTNLSGGDALNGSSTQAGRVSLNLHPNDKFNDDLIVGYENDDPSGVAYKSTTFYPANSTTGQVIGDLNPYTATAMNTSPLLEGGAAPNTRRTLANVTNILTYRFGGAFKLTSTSSIRRFYGAELFDPDGTTLPILMLEDTGNGNQYSQDFRLNYDPGGKVSAFGGISGLDTEQRQTYYEVYNEPMALALLTGVLDRTNPVAGPVAAYGDPNLMAVELQGIAASGGLNLPDDQALGIADNLNPTHYEQYLVRSHVAAYDAYLNGTYRPVDTVELSAGVRYSTEHKTSGFAGQVGSRSALGGVVGVAQVGAALGLNPATTGNCGIPQVFAANALCQILAGLAQPGANSLAGPLPLFGIQVQPTTGNGREESGALNDGGWTWNLTARYKPRADLDAYASYARGRRPEVLTAEAPAAPFGPARFAVAPAETLDSYEIGAKSRFFDRRLSLNGAVYYYHYDNFQVTEIVGTEFVTFNAGNAETYGFEGDATWAVTPMADLFATYAYTHGRYLNTILKGNQFRLTPEHAVTLGADWRIDGPGGVFEIIPSYRWQSEVFFNDDNGNKLIQEEQGPLVPPLVTNQYQTPYSLVDLRVGYTPARGNWTIAAFGTNITNTRYLKDSGNTGINIGLPTDIPGDPAFYGVAFTLKR